VTGIEWDFGRWFLEIRGKFTGFLLRIYSWVVALKFSTKMSQKSRHITSNPKYYMKIQNLRL
jgi:hypothetical protein